MVKCWPGGLLTQVAEDSMCTSKSRKDDGIDTLARECGISDAIQARNVGGIEWHSYHTKWSSGRDWAIRSIDSVEETPVCFGCTNVFENDGLRQSWEDLFQSLDEFFCDLILLL